MKPRGDRNWIDDLLDCRDWGEGVMMSRGDWSWIDRFAYQALPSQHTDPVLMGDAGRPGKLTPRPRAVTPDGTNRLGTRPGVAVPVELAAGGGGGAGGRLPGACRPAGARV